MKACDIRTDADLAAWAADPQNARTTTLSLYGTGVTDLSPLAGMTGMTTLSLYGTRVTDLSPLAEMKKCKVYR